MEKNLVIASILVTLDEVEFIPESLLYLAAECSLDDWYLLKAALIETGLITETYNAVSITPKGHDLAVKLNKLLATRKQ